MVALKLNTFGGMIPATDARLLPDNMAVLARDAWLYSGALEGIREAKAIYTPTQSTTKYVFRIPKNYSDRDHITDAYWLEFPYEDVSVIRSPVADDQYDRYYWTSVGTGPQYNTLARIDNGSAPLTLGVPYPLNFPTVTTSGGTSTVTVSRSYVYTWVTEFGEEGAPSAPSLTTGKQDDTWSIGITPPTVLERANRRLDKVRIYRTITASNGATTYFMVAEVALTTTLYSDTKTDAQISGSPQLSSTLYTPPPADLSGFATLPNGMVVGFRSNEVWYCEPYRPHAWPAAYTLTVDSPIVGIGVIGQTTIVCSKTSVYACTGTHPSVVTQANISTIEPCMSRGSIISTPSGVFFASPNGIAVVTPTGIVNATEKLFTREKWLAEFKVAKLRAARLGSIYYMFTTVASGCFQETAFEPTAFEKADFTGAVSGGMIDASDARTAYVRLSATSPTFNVWNDVWTNEVFVLRNGIVYQIELSESRPRSEYTWKSKRFQTPNRRNLEAMKVFFDNPEGLTSLGSVKVYADDRLVTTRNITSSGALMRLPSGFKANFWQIEVTTKVIISSIQVATSVKELASV